MWTRFKDGLPSDGASFAVMFHDGSGGYAYLRSGQSCLGCEDAMEESMDRFSDDDLWSELPKDFELYFMAQHDDF